MKTLLRVNLINVTSKSRNSKLSWILPLVKINIIIADADELAVARAHLQETADKTRLTNAGLNDKLNCLEAENENVRRKIADTERYLDQLIVQEKALRDKIMAYENENNGLDGDITATIEDIGVLDNRIMDA